MIKNSFYDGTILSSAEIDSVPHADMKGILTRAIPGSWADYEQVLNSSSDLQYDLDIKFVEGYYWIPVANISSWLYSFSLRTMQGEIYERFRIYRRDLEKVFRVTWAMPADDLVIAKYDPEWCGNDGGHSIYELNNIFSAYGIPDEELQDIDEEGRVFGPLHYIEFVCGGTHCGSRGHLVCNQIQYIESLPNGDEIFDHINETLIKGIPASTEYLDDYLDELNIFISGITSRFIGEL